MDIKSRLTLLQRERKSVVNKPSDMRTRLDSLIRPRSVFNKFGSVEINEIIEGNRFSTEYGEIFVTENTTNIVYNEFDDEITTSLQIFISKDGCKDTYKLSEKLVYNVFKKVTAQCYIEIC